MTKQIQSTILAVDDEQDILALIKEILSDFDYQVVTASSGEEALEKLNHISPNLILLDISMPKMDGLTVLTRIKQNPKTSIIPVMMLTARIESTTIWKAKDLGAADYIVKPFKAGELMKWIRIYERFPEKPKWHKGDKSL